MSRPVRVVRELTEADPTPGMRREQAISVDGLWAGLVHTDPGAASGWHHHGQHETSLYVVSGTLRMSFGPGGLEQLDAGPGEFVHIPAGTVHREANPTGEMSLAVIARAGRGAPTVNVEGPDPA